MLKIQHSFMLLLLLAASQLSFAVSALTEHTLSVSKSMSAFYMYSLTDGDTQYKADYEQYLSDAQLYLDDYEKEDSVSAIELQRQWNKFKGHLKFDYVEGAGFIIPVTLRLEYRTYLNVLYKKISGISNSEANLSEQLALMSLSVEVMSARFFDIASALYGTISISNKDVVIDAPKMAKAFNLRLKYLQKLKLAGKVKKNLKIVEKKWSFIEGSVTNYNVKAPYLLVYYNKEKIGRLLNQSQGLLAGA